MRTIYIVGRPADDPLTPLLERSGYYTQPMEDAYAAWGALSALRADGFVIDVGDPAVGGERLIGMLRRSAAWRGVPIVVTGASTLLGRRLALRIGPGVVMRPAEIGADAVLDRLRRLVPGVQGATEVPRVPEPPPHERPASARRQSAQAYRPVAREKVPAA